MSIAATAPNGVALVLHVHITSGTPQVNELPDSSEEDVEKDASLDGDDTKSRAELDAISDTVDILSGRPDIFKLLESEVALATGPVSVDGKCSSHSVFAPSTYWVCVVAGPASLQADTRKALTGHFAGPTNVLKGTPTVQLNIEEFSM